MLLVGVVTLMLQLALSLLHRTWAIPPFLPLPGRKAEPASEVVIPNHGVGDPAQRGRGSFERERGQGRACGSDRGGHGTHERARAAPRQRRRARPHTHAAA